MNSSCDIQSQLAGFAANFTFEQLPEEVRAASRTFLLDTIATTLAGSTAPGVSEVLGQLLDWGGKPESTAAVFGAQLPAPSAAMANAVMAHALDFDDTFDETALHANVCVVPALLAAAEARGGVSGRELIVAHVVGLEISCRLALAAGRALAPGWLPTTVFGCFGATAAAGRASGLTSEQMKNALGIVYNYTGGNRQGLLDGALTKRIQPGLYAQSAVTASALAARGISGPHRAFDGKYGLFPLLIGDACDLSSITEGLGERFELLRIGLKPYPCCRGTHASIEATLELSRGERFHEKDIEGVTVYLENQAVADLVGQAFVIRDNPQVDGQFSVRYTVAAALLRGGIGLSDFDETSVRDAQTGMLAQRIAIVVDPQRHGMVEVRFATGETRAARAEYPGGHPSRPLSREAMAAKLADCARRSAKPLDAPQLAALERLVTRLESVEDVSEILAATVGTVASRTSMLEAVQAIEAGSA